MILHTVHHTRLQRIQNKSIINRMFHVAFNIFAFREIRNIILENYRNYSNNSGSLELKQLQSEQ